MTERKTILIIEDDKDIRESVRILLEGEALKSMKRSMVWKVLKKFPIKQV